MDRAKNKMDVFSMLSIEIGEFLILLQHRFLHFGNVFYNTCFGLRQVPKELLLVEHFIDNPRKKINLIEGSVNTAKVLAASDFFLWAKKVTFRMTFLQNSFLQSSSGRLLKSWQPVISFYGPKKVTIRMTFLQNSFFQSSGGRRTRDLWRCNPDLYPVYH
jgi:hypothetical protein